MNPIPSWQNRTPNHNATNSGDHVAETIEREIVEQYGSSFELTVKDVKRRGNGTANRELPAEDKKEMTLFWARADVKLASCLERQLCGDIFLYALLGVQTSKGTRPSLKPYTSVLYLTLFNHGALNKILAYTDQAGRAAKNAQKR